MAELKDRACIPDGLVKLLTSLGLHFLGLLVMLMP